MSQNTPLSHRITEARDAAGLSIAQIARRLAVKTKTIENWESGVTSPRTNKLQMLAGVLGVPLLWLIDGGAEYDPMPTRPGRLDLLEQKVERMNNLQRELQQLNNEIAVEIAAIRKIDDELEELAA